ncbi:MAG: pyruvate kinase alpha/beta domain-containing protein, partial [Galactobacter sp.]
TLTEENLVEAGDLVVVVAGSPPGRAGSTNSLRVQRITPPGTEEADQGLDQSPREDLRPWRTREEAAGDLVRRMNERS